MIEFFLKQIDNNFNNYNPINILIAVLGLPIVGLYGMFILSMMAFFGWIMTIFNIKIEDINN